MKTIQEFYTEEIQKFKDQTVYMVKDLIEKNGSIDPTLIALVIKEENLTIAILEGLGQMFGDDGSKEQAVKMIKEFNKEIKPIAIAFISEAYILEIPENKTAIDDDGTYLDDTYRPSVNPDSKDCVIMSLETFDKEGLMYWELIKMGDVTDLVLVHDLELSSKKVESKAKGLLADLLNENYSELAELTKKSNNNFNLN